MNCPIMLHLGVYALGAADPEERSLVESHLPGCPACRAELARLTPLPKLLGRVPVSMLAGDRRGQNRIRQVPVRPRRVAVTAAAVAAASGVAAGIWLSSPGASSLPAVMTLSGSNPVTHVRATVTLTATSSGTTIQLRASGLPLNQPCHLIVRSRTGGTENTGTWDAWGAGPVSYSANATLRPSDIASLQVATAANNLLTITARRLDHR
jgi:hypothetical protein